MPASLPLDAHLQALAISGARLVELVEGAGDDAPVPTCPAWNARALLAHQAMVHRWAAAHVAGGGPGQVPTQTELRSHADLTGYYRAGLAELIGALERAPDDLEAMTFLNDAPPPRRFWARRQAHETTIHMVDALAASLGRVPAVEDAAIDAELAADGVDELLCGFFTRGRSKLFDGEDLAVGVVATDVGRRWMIHVAERLSVTASGEGVGAEPEPDATVTGTAAELYLDLWNRAPQHRDGGPTTTGRADVIERWHEVQRVSWS